MVGLVGLLACARGEENDRASRLRDNVIEQLGLADLVEAAAEGGAESGENESTVGEAPQADAILVPQLQGLVLLADQEKVESESIQFSEPKVENRGVDLPEGIEAELSSFLAKPLTLRLLDDAVRQITAFYRENDRPVVDAYLPEQDISGGVVQIVVIEGKVGEIRVSGAEHSKEEYLLSQMKLKPGDPIRQSAVEKDVKWLNDHPLRRVDAVFEPGEEQGTTNIVLKTSDAKPVRLSSGIDNTGLELTGENQFNAGITWGRLLGTEQLLAYQFSADLEFENLDAHSGFYRVPLPWRHRLEFLGAYVVSDVDVPIDGEIISLGGESLLLGGEYIIPVLDAPFGFERFEFSLGSEYKSTNSDVEFGGASVFDETAAVWQFSLGWEGERPDKWGATGLGATVYWSPGDLVGNNDEESFNSQRGGASSDYFYTELTLERLLHLPRDFRLAWSATGQWSNSRLISTEQILAGGYRTVRGFDENLVRGDVGVLTTLELLLPSMKVLKRKDDSLQATVFFDAAWLRSVERTAAEPDQNLSSLGVDVRYRLSRFWSMRAGYGWQLSTNGVEGIDEDGKFHFGATLSY